MQKGVGFVTKAQVKVCKIIRRYKRLPIILEKTHAEDYLDLQYMLPGSHLDFSDDHMDEKTLVVLDDFLTEELERYEAEHNDVLINRVLAIYGAITATIAIGVEIWLHFLQ